MKIINRYDDEQLLTTIKINNSSYKVVFVNPNNHSLSTGSDTAICNYIEKRIFISNSLSDDELLPIIVHELTHAYIYEYSQKQFTRDTTWDHEDLCVFMENYGISIVHTALDIYNLLEVKEDGTVL